jgi:hypothetical protein
MDTIARLGKTRNTGQDYGAATERPQAGNDARRWGGVRAIWRRGDDDYLTDALALLKGWTRDGIVLRRVLRLDDSQHAALTERIQVAADALEERPQVRRLDGHTQIVLTGEVNGPLAPNTVSLAARIEDAYRHITGRG